MPGKIGKILRLAADMQDLAEPEDELTALIREIDMELEEDELSMDELEMVVAASKNDDYEHFKTLLNDMDK
ncbi:MAG: hypothetical protein E7332_02350 [Clostridiales bacterium]|nr:hypothetical protein [Clostridiales bacterium]MBR3842289.1 hypothetical protein [Christensenellaceae bacterium]